MLVGTGFVCIVVFSVMTGGTTGMTSPGAAVVDVVVGGSVVGGGRTVVVVDDVTVVVVVVTGIRPAIKRTILGGLLFVEATNEF